MLWYLVDALAILVAVAVVVVGFPGRRARQSRRALLERAAARQSSKASPRRDSSSTT